MKTSILYNITALLLTLVISSCAQEELQDEGVGYLHVDTELDCSVVPVVKSSAEPVTLTIFKSTGEEVGSYPDVEDMGTVELKTGSYRAVATQGSKVAAAFDVPFYSVSKDFTIKNSVVENLDLKLTLENVKVTSEFSQNVADNFSSYVLTVTNGAGTLVYDSNAEGGSTLDKEGYFTATGTLTWTLKLVNKQGETFNSLTETYDNVQPRQHYHLKFDVEPQKEEGGSAFKITVNDSMNDKSYDLVLDFVNKDVPKIQTEVDLSGKNTYYTGDKTVKNFVITTPNKQDFTSLTISHNSAALETAGLARELELVGLETQTVEELATKGIILTAVSSGIHSSEITLTEFIASLPAGSYEIEFAAANVTGASKLWSYQFEIKGSVEAVSVNPWARFVSVEGQWFSNERPAGINFAYKTVAEGEWTMAEEELLVFDDARKTYKADIPLSSGTEYVIKAVTEFEKATKELAFSTEQEQVIPNMNFDAWYYDGAVPFPNASSSEFYWDTANAGSKAMNVYPTTDEAEIVKSGKAAKLVSSKVAVAGLAAGNIYTGKFVRAIISLSNPGAELDWGIPFTSRPLALKGWYHYKPTTINQGSHAGMSGKMDIGQIQIFLTDWTGPFRINTQSKTFVEPNASYVLGYGSMELNETSGYTEFEIKVEYRNMTKKPTYIVIVGAASKYGDYFTGGVGSTLYLDEFSFEYDPSKLTK